MEKIGESLLKFTHGASTFIVNATEGARLMNWSINLADGAVRDVIYWPANAPYSGEGFTKTLGGNPILFPFCGKSYVEGKEGFWMSPEGNLLPMKMHGYAKDGQFVIEAAHDSGFTARFIPSEECKIAYPYNYEFRVSYRFSELAFSCELNLKNNGDEKIPWGAGIHPYFTLPWHSGQTRKMYRLKHDAKKASRFIMETGAFLPEDLDKNCFDDAEFNNRILTNFKTSELSFGLKNGEEDVRMVINSGGRPDPALCVVTWSLNDESPYYCVEPWISVPNSASTPKQFVAPGSSKSFIVDISLG